MKIVNKHEDLSVRILLKMGDDEYFHLETAVRRFLELFPVSLSLY